MSIPGFAAEASLYKPNQQYTAVRAFGRRTNGVRTQLLIPVKPPGPQHVPGVDIVCDPVCWETCCHPSAGYPPFDCNQTCSYCCWLEYFPPR
jgi:hypothetical protein